MKNSKCHEADIPHGWWRSRSDPRGPVSGRHPRCSLLSLASTPCSCTQIPGFALRLATLPDLLVTPQRVIGHNLPLGLAGCLLLVTIKILTRDITEHFLLKLLSVLAFSSCLKCLCTQIIRKYISRKMKDPL